MIPYAYIGGAVAVLFSVAILYHYTEISSLEDTIQAKNNSILKLERKIDDCKEETLVEKLNYITCKTTLTKQNLVKAELQSALDKKRLEYEQLKNNPEKIYIDIIKYLPKEYKDESCETVIDSIRDLNINSL